MVIPGSVHGILVETTCQAAGEMAFARQSFRRWLDRSVDAGAACFAAWDALLQAGLRAPFDFLNAAIQTARAALEAGSPKAAPSDRWNRTGRIWPNATLELTSGGTRVVQGAARPNPPSGPDPGRAEDWADSALSYPPPLGMVTWGYAETLDEEP